jgi:hypothetical protein
MWLLDEIAEARIAEAVERGDFDNLPGAGKPVNLDDDVLVPEELRVAYRVLKNAGYVPQEIELRKEIDSVEALLAHAQQTEERLRAAKRLSLLMTRLSAIRGESLSLERERVYRDRMAERLDGDG